VIAAIEGYAVAGGLELAAWCDLRVAASDAKLGVFCRRWGVPLIDGGTVRLPRLIGESRAADLILTGREVDAEEALRLGLVSRVVSDEELLETALDTARTMAGYTRTGLLNTKEVLWHNADTTSMAAAIALENRNQSLAARAPDVIEHMTGYRDRTTGSQKDSPSADS
jgi:enoyl-CoA hydratase